MASKNYDNHTLYVKSGVARNDQLCESLKRAISQASTVLGTPLKVMFKVNLIMLRDNRPVGYGYIRVSNPVFYHLLCGRNADGSERAEYIDDPDWVPPVENSNYDMAMPDNWADLADEEDEKICPKIKKVLPPLITVDGYVLDSAQKDTYVKQVIEDAKRAGTYKEGMEVVAPVKSEFEISAAFVANVEENYCPNVLCARNVPKWISEQSLKAVFTPYTTDSTTLIKRHIAGKETKDTYPFVSINSEGIAFITFDPRSYDGQFCLLMTKKLELTNTKDTNNKATLVFSHSFRTGSRGRA